MPDRLRRLQPKERNEALSRFSRNCLGLSSRKSGLDIRTFNKRDTGVPLPENGVFWSVSHKPDMVAGVVSTVPAGIDVEKVTDVSKALFKRIVSVEEKSCFNGEDNARIFFRCFTAKEAVLKCQGIGLKGLSTVKITRVMDSKNLWVVSGRHAYRIESFHAGDFLSSVVKNDFNVEWTFMDSENQEEC